MAEQEPTASVDVDEYADLGMDESAVACVSKDVHDGVFEALNLKPISIRLPESLIEAFKAIASLHGVGYQPLMRDALERFAGSEMKRLTVEYSNKVAAQAQKDLAQAQKDLAEEPELRKAA